MVSRSPFTRAAAWLLATILLVPPHASSDARPRDWNPSINPADFTGVVVDTPYFPLPSGRTLLYRGTSADRRFKGPSRSEKPIMPNPRGIWIYEDHGRTRVRFDVTY